VPDALFDDLWLLNPDALGGLLLPLVILWVLLAIAAGKVASDKRRGAVRWFVAALVFTPVLAFPVLLSLHSVAERDTHTIPLTDEMTRCPTCHETVSAAPSHCVNCGEQLPDT
jgi:hypothetical protein